MARTAMTELQQQIEAIRREAFAAGYAAAMEAVRDLTSRSAPGAASAAAAQRAIPPADIRRALQQRGVEMAFTSIRHALGQLQQRNAAEPVGNSNTWRHRGG